MTFEIELLYELTYLLRKIMESISIWIIVNIIQIVTEFTLWSYHVKSNGLRNGGYTVPAFYRATILQCWILNLQGQLHGKIVSCIPCILFKRCFGTHTSEITVTLIWLPLTHKCFDIIIMPTDCNFKLSWKKSERV